MRKRKSTRSHPLANLEFLFNKGSLELSPKYQRDSVWTLPQKQLLIDSLLSDIDIPKLYFRESSDEGDKFEVVDGQQRLRAILSFLKNEFKMPKDSDPVENHDIKGLQFNDLPTDVQMKLRNTTLDIVELSSGYSDEDVEETFLRLQNGTPLNAPEKRRAINGSMRSVVQELAKHKIFTLCSFDNKRFGHEDAVAKLLHLQLAGAFTDIRHQSLKRTYETYNSITNEHSAVKRPGERSSLSAKRSRTHLHLGSRSLQ